MFYLSPEGDRYTLGKAFSYGDYSYSSSGANEHTFNMLGFTQVNLDTAPNPNYYLVSPPDDNGQYTSTPKDLESLKIKLIVNEKQNMRYMLEKTNHYIIDRVELEQVIPTGVTILRTQIRQVAAARCAAIAGTTTIAELETLIEGGNLQQYPEQDSESDSVATEYGYSYSGPTDFNPGPGY